MKKLFLLPMLLFAQSGSIIDVSTGSRCTAVFSPATAATDVQIDCTTVSKPVLTGAKINLAAITGNTNGFVISYATTPDSVTVLLRRTAAGQPLHIEATVNGSQVVNKDVVVP